MSDTVSKEKRSWIMSRIRSEDTKPEWLVRQLLHRLGYRYRLHGAVSKKLHPAGRLPGKPDLVLAQYRLAIFVHGCFWHRHPGCKVATMPRSRQAFWREKFERNMARDQKNRAELRRLGWKVLVLWECQVMKGPESILARLRRQLPARPETDYGDLPEKREWLQVAEDRLQYQLRRPRQ